MGIRGFVKESREYMAELTDAQFYARLPLALCIYIWMKLKGVFQHE